MWYVKVVHTNGCAPPQPNKKLGTITVPGFFSLLCFSKFQAPCRLKQKAARYAGGIQRLSKEQQLSCYNDECSSHQKAKERCCSLAESLAHTKWMCMYHIVFTPKYRRKVIYYGLRDDIRQIIRDLCKWKGIAIIEGHMMPDHICFSQSRPNIAYRK